MSDTNVPRMGQKTRIVSGVLAVALTESDVGCMLAVKPADGLIYKAANTAGLRVVGINDNMTGDLAIGDTVRASQGIYCLTNSTGSAVAAANLNNTCVVEDNFTVATSASKGVVAGTVVAIDSAGVWVDVGVENVPTIGA